MRRWMAFAVVALAPGWALAQGLEGNQTAAPVNEPVPDPDAPKQYDVSPESLLMDAASNLTGMDDFAADIEIEQKGASREVSFAFKMMTNDSGLKRRLVTLREPAMLKGLSVLIHDTAGGEPEKWLYMPRFNRLRRMGDLGEAGPLAGNEFAMGGDFGIQDILASDFTIEGEDTIDGAACYIIKATPPEGSTMPPAKVWIEIDAPKLRKLEVKQPDGSPRATILMSSYQEFDGLWRPSVIDMTNHVENRGAIARFSNMSFNNGFTESDFEKEGLEKLR